MKKLPALILGLVFLYFVSYLVLRGTNQLIHRKYFYRGDAYNFIDLNPRGFIDPNPGKLQKETKIDHRRFAESKSPRPIYIIYFPLIFMEEIIFPIWD